uniref:Hexose transporter 1 n=1 Tax=Rhizochromulina marina TaxID=1034831 RepID=A0A7S2SGC3_9STRA|mmetsp:Transcript_28954/g.84513  ORF Transcript_28954/g.84513 Transcript_28954/m.84513 type:complete len:204 (+) Transcript_28954:3-614(+)
MCLVSGSILQTAGLDNANEAGAYVMATQVVFTAVACVMMDKAGRRTLMAVSSSGMAVCISALGIFFAMGKKPSWLALLSLMGYVTFFALAMGPVPWLYMAEIFPDSVRGPACSLATLVNWAGGFVVTYFFASIISVLTATGVFFLFGAFCLACFVFVLGVMPETKGKSLQQIEQELLGETVVSALHNDDANDGRDDEEASLQG